MITGIGVVSPIGIGVSEFEHSLHEGISGIKKISLCDVTDIPCKLAAEIDAAQFVKYLPKNRNGLLSRQSLFAVKAANLAYEDAGSPSIPLNETDVILGCGGMAFDVIENALADGVSPLDAQKGFMFAPACAVSYEISTSGRVDLVSSACTSAFNAVKDAAVRIETGSAKCVIAGGTEAPITRFSLQSMYAAGLLTDSMDPSRAVAPFDSERDKSLMGEGAAIFILEEEKSAKKRGAKIYAAFAGGHAWNENTGKLYRAQRSGQKWADLIARVLKKRNIDLINAHGPGHSVIDLIEYRALKRSFGDTLNVIPVTSIKGSIGSGMAAAGAFQIAATLLMIQRGVVFKAANFAIPDPEIPLKITTKTKKVKIGRVLQLARAVGGQIAVQVFERV